MSHYKPDSARQWRGKSYKKGGELVTELREDEMLRQSRLADEAFAEESEEEHCTCPYPDCVKHGDVAFVVNLTPDDDRVAMESCCVGCSKGFACECPDHPDGKDDNK